MRRQRGAEEIEGLTKSAIHRAGGALFSAQEPCGIGPFTALRATCTIRPDGSEHNL